MATPNVQTPHEPAPSTRLQGLAPRTAAMLADAARLVDRLDYDGAERALTGALALAPTHPETQRLLGLIAHRRGRHTEAEDIYRRALAAHPYDATLVSQYGDLRVDAGDSDGGLMLLRHASGLASADAGVWL